MTEFPANPTFTHQINQLLHLPSPLQKLEDELFLEKKLTVFVKRDDLIHSEISGNKWRKLKYNLLNIKALGYESLLTFGGAFSNHIYATAAAGKYLGIETIGIIRGDELNENSSLTLKFASDCGMKLQFVTRNTYREIRHNNYIHSHTQSLNHAFVIPEGGTNEFALGGVGEMVEEIEIALGKQSDYIICPVGTGGTMAGIMANASENTKVLGICVLKNGQYLENEINLLLKNAGKILNPASINFDNHQGGYAKKTTELINFIASFEAKYSFKIEPVYSGKMFFAFDKLVKQNYFAQNSTIVLIHTGGLQHSITIL